MTLVAGRMHSLHTLERRPYPEDGSMPGILKSGPRKQRGDTNHCIERSTEHNQRSDDGKRLVRFCEAGEQEKYQQSEKDESDSEEQDVIMFGSNMYYINNSDPNSAVRKLFPNSKLTPINPFLSKLQSKDMNSAKTKPSISKVHENNYNLNNRTAFRSDERNKNSAIRVVDRNTGRRNLSKIPPQTKPKTGKVNEPSKTLVERIRQLTCDSNDIDEISSKSDQGNCKPNYLSGRNYGTLEQAKPFVLHIPKEQNYFQEQKVSDLPKQAKEGLNLMRYNQNILQTRSQASKTPLSPSKSSPTDEVRRSFLSTLSQDTKCEPGDRTSMATNSTTADTVYSLSDIEEALTEEEKEIKEAFAQEIKQDELELFVQQDAGRTERLRKRYSGTPKPENPPAFFLSGNNYPLQNPNLRIPHYTNSSCTMKKDRPKFGSTIEILQQLQQQIETPYQLEGRRTACSNYSDSSMPISERLFCDESSDGYEPIQPKLHVHRTCSLDSKNYEEIDNFPSAFSVPRTKSQEHPRLTLLEPDPYFYSQPSVRYSANFAARSVPFEQSVYASSPNLHGYQPAMIPNRVSSYNNLPENKSQLHPVLQKQYCRYPVMETPRPVEEGKVLTPPVRMHTYINVPVPPSAPSYPSPPPPYTKVNPYGPPVYPYDSPPNHNNIYQNVPPSTNAHAMSIRRLCTDRERGVPEGASSSHDSAELYPSPSPAYYFPTNTATIPKPSSLPHHYCVDV